MARPRKSDPQRRTRQIIFRLTEAEHARLATVATQAGLSANELARRLTGSRAERVTLRVAHQHDPAFIAQLRAVGNNLNQLTMRSHLTGRVSPKIEVLCDEIREIVLAAVEERTGG
jgi:AraC-like DNA-binding protein